MAQVHYLSHSEYERIFNGIQLALKRELLPKMIRLNALARSTATTSAIPENCLNAYLCVATQVFAPEVTSSATVLAEAAPQEPAMLALRHALGSLSDLFEESTIAVNESTFRLAAPGHGLSLAVGITLAKALRDDSERTILMLEDSATWPRSAAIALPDSQRKLLKRLCVVAPLNVEDEQDRDELELQMIACGWTVVFCEPESVAEYLAKTAYLQSPTLLIYKQRAELLQSSHSLTVGGQHTLEDELEAGEAFQLALDDLDQALAKAGISGCELECFEYEAVTSLASSRETLALEVTRELLLQMSAYENLIVIDATASPGVYLRAVSRQYPDRYLRCNGAQDAVAHAAGIAAAGSKPVVIAQAISNGLERYSFNQSNGLLISLNAGLQTTPVDSNVPELFDAARVAARSECATIHPSCADEALAALRFALEAPGKPCYMRMQGSATDPEFTLPNSYYFSEGRGSLLRAGDDAIVFAYGPLMLSQCLRTSEILAAHDFQLAVVNLPWLNRTDLRWLRPLISSYEQVHVCEDHATIGALGDNLLRECTAHGLLERRQLRIHGVDRIPAAIQGSALLQHLELDADSLAATILKSAGERRLSRKALQAARKLRAHSKSTTPEEGEQQSLLDIDLELMKTLD